MPVAQRQGRLPRSTLLGVVLPLGLGALLMLVDLIEGPRTQFVGLLVACPFLAASFVGPARTAFVGAGGLALGATYAAYEGVGTTRSQLIRLALILAATAIAMGVARERLARERRLLHMATIAEVAQRTVLRPLPPEVGGVRLAVRYVSAVAEAHIGGDLYEAVTSAHGTRLLVGDVRGKGLSAVRLAAAVTGAFRSLAPRDLTLEQLVRELEDVVHSNHTEAEPEEEFVTAVLVEVAGGGRVRSVLCGHPAPLVLEPGGGPVQDLPGDSQLPLGLGVEVVVTTTTLPPGTRLLLHTDGATDVRRQGVWFPLEEAVSRLAGLPLDAALDRLEDELRAWGGGTLPDDAALLLVEL